MTGYGSSQHKSRQLELDVQIKSVNGRFLEIRFHLPKEYAPFENEFRKAFVGWQRGTVDVYVSRRPTGESRLQTVQLNEANARFWTKQLQGLATKLKLPADIHLRDVLQMPFVLETQERLALLPDEIKTLTKLLEKAAQQCQKMRLSEGLVLRKELIALLKSLEARVVSMEGWRQEAVEAAETRLQSRLAGLQREALDPTRLAMEMALVMDKMDVHEEIVRLREHVKACRALIEVEDARGKKLDFYCQELLREVNTIGSKSQLTSLTAIVVEAKSLIEKFREQVQNIE